MSPRQDSGFTLIEVIIALGLLAVLATASSQSIQSSLRSKKQIQLKIDLQSIVRDALEVIKRDVSKAFNYYDFHAELYNETQKERIKRCEDNARKNNKSTGTGTQTGDTSGGDTGGTGGSGTTQTNTNLAQALEVCNKMKENFKEKKQSALTQFLGEEDNMHFTSSGHIRSLQNAAESNLAEVGYFIESCKSRKTRKSISRCLWRRTTAFIDDDVKKDGDKTVLVEGIKEFKLEYIGPGTDEEWIKNWKTDESGDARTKDIFPDAVKVTLAVEQKVKNQKAKTYKLVIVAPIRFPNNIKKEREKQKAEEEAAKANAEQNKPTTPTPAPTPGGTSQ